MSTSQNKIVSSTNNKREIDNPPQISIPNYRQHIKEGWGNNHDFDEQRWKNLHGYSVKAFDFFFDK